MPISRQNNQITMKSLFNTLYEGILYILKSLDTEKGGGSARKLSAFIAVNGSFYLCLKNTTPENLEALLIVWLIFASICLGLVTIEQLIKFKSEHPPQ